MEKQKTLFKPTSAKFVAFTGILTALALVLSLLEASFPPLPMMPPGAKLGLSNLVTMYAAGSMGLIPAIFIALVKGFFAVFTRGFLAGIMSLSGGFCSTFIMWLLFEKTSFSLLGIGVCGAVVHNGAQLAIAAWLTTTAVFIYIPALIFYSIAAGLVTGIMLKLIMPALNRISPN